MEQNNVDKTIVINQTPERTVKPLTLTRWVVLNCDGKPLGYEYPWTFDTEADTAKLAEHFANSSVKKVRITIEEMKCE